MRFAIPAALASLVAATLLPGRPLGIGAVLVAALAAAAVGRWGALPLVFVGAAAFRDAGWVVALDLVAAVVLSSISLAGGETFAQLVRASVAVVTRLPRLPSLVPPPPEARRLAPAARGALLGGVLVVPFGALFLSADAAFAQLSSDALPSLGGLPGRVATFGVVSLVTAGLFAAARGGPASKAPPPRRLLGPLESTIALALLDLLFLAFVLVQLTVLFAGHDHVLETAGLTYAEYARQGFGELLVVAALTLAVVVLARRYGARGVVPRVLLAVLCALTLVVLASSLRRLGLYEDAYGFTRARLAAHGLALWLGGLVVLAATGWRRAPRAAVAWTALGLAAFTIANPDRLVADRNVDRWHSTGKIDTGYLGRLSADAVPALEGLPAGLRERALAPISARLRVGDSWSSWNLARSRARQP